MTEAAGAPGGAEALGEEVLAAALADARASLRSRLVSAYRLGSLAHGGFSPDVSDVDLGLLLDDVRPGDEARIAAVRDGVVARLGTPLAGRLSIFWSSWGDLAAGTGAGRFPLVDQLDLRRDGQLLLGPDRRADVPRPGADALVLEGARFMVARLADPSRDAVLRDPEALLARGVREASKAVLFPVRFLATAQTGDVLANPQAAAHVTATHAGPVAAVTAAALEWRATGLGVSDADRAADADVLAAGLAPLYAAVAEAYGTRLVELGRPDLADAIRSWVGRVWPAG